MARSSPCVMLSWPRASMCLALPTRDVELGMVQYRNLDPPPSSAGLKLTHLRERIRMLAPWKVATVDKTEYVLEQTAVRALTHKGLTVANTETSDRKGKGFAATLRLAASELGLRSQEVPSLATCSPRMHGSTRSCESAGPTGTGLPPSQAMRQWTCLRNSTRTGCVRFVRALTTCRFSTS
jgi:hypothetical protein